MILFLSSLSLSLSSPSLSLAPLHLCLGVMREILIVETV
jgi:hypothetical protein